MLSLFPAESPIEFKLAGRPIGQGSKIALVSGKRVVRMEAGRRVTWIRNPIASLVEQGNRATKSRSKGALETWRQRIAHAAQSSMGVRELMTGPVVLQCVFVFPRKEEHFKKSGGLKSTAPTIPGNDLDKYMRAVGDSLSGVVYRDDRQVTRNGDSRKRFGTTKGQGGVYVKVWGDDDVG